jgi:antitoxin YobK
VNGPAAIPHLRALLQEHTDRVMWTGGASEDRIAQAQLALGGVVFPPSYQAFLREIGDCSGEGVELEGIVVRPEADDRLLGVVSETLDARQIPGFPHHLLVFEQDGMGGLVCLDMSDVDARGEAPIVVWDPAADARGGTEVLASDFGWYALARFARALEAPVPGSW